MSNWNLRYANDVDEEQDSSMAKFHSRSAELLPLVVVKKSIEVNVLV